MKNQVGRKGRWLIGGAFLLVLSIASIGVADAVGRSYVRSKAISPEARRSLIEIVRGETLAEVESAVKGNLASLPWYKDIVAAIFCGSDEAVIAKKKRRAQAFVTKQKQSFSLEVIEPNWGLGWSRSDYRLGAKWKQHLLATFRLDAYGNPTGMRDMPGRRHYRKAVTSAVGEDC